MSKSHKIGNSSGNFGTDSSTVRIVIFLSFGARIPSGRGSSVNNKRFGICSDSNGSSEKAISALVIMDIHFSTMNSKEEVLTVVILR